MYSAPPVLPPKPGSHEASRMGTPAASSQSPRPPPFPDQQGGGGGLPEAASGAQQQQQQPEQIPEDPGDQWLPKMLEDRKQDLADILSTPALLSALTHGPGAAHASLAARRSALASALAANVELARHLCAAEARLSAARGSAQAQLLGARALERQWHARLRDADAALAPFAPDGLYLRLAQACQEQAAVCDALEESFLDRQHRRRQRQQQQQQYGGRRGGGGEDDDEDDDDDDDDGGSRRRRGGGGGGVGGGGGRDNDAPATERETLDWVRQYREARKLLYLRQERKERWDEGRVGGWR
ncbi:hypothetical protein RB594_002587 [Gaeumannomyces avenae]